MGGVRQCDLLILGKHMHLLRCPSPLKKPQLSLVCVAFHVSEILVINLSNCSRVFLSVLTSIQFSFL